MKRLVWLLRLLVFVIFLVFLFINNNYVSLNSEDIKIQNEPQMSEAVTVLQLSDFHGKVFSTKQRKLTLMFDRLDYDVVALTGDVVDENTKNFTFIEFLLAYFKDRDKPVLFVTGNHEGANPLYPELETLMNSYGVIMLDNDVYKYNSGGQEVTFVGLSDPNVTAYDTSLPIVNGYLEEVANANGKSVVLSHRPAVISDLRGKADVILSGHNHGGQIRLPFIGGIISPEEGWFPTYDYGLFAETDTQTGKTTSMYVSKGLGNSVIPIRLFNFPEVALLTIQ